MPIPPRSGVKFDMTLEQQQCRSILRLKNYVLAILCLTGAPEPQPPRLSLNSAATALRARARCPLRLGRADARVRLCSRVRVEQKKKSWWCASVRC